MSKIILIGANHAGTAAANTILDNYPNHELIIFDRNSNISYLGCGTALWVGKQIDGPEGLFYSSKEALEAKNAKVHMECEITHIDFDQKKVCAKDKNGKELIESYDKLIIATGSLPITPAIKGIDLKNVQSVKLYQDGQMANSLLDNPNIKNIAVVGAGYIGVELAEAVQRRGKKALLFDVAHGSLGAYYDPWFSDDMDKNLASHGIELHYGQRVCEIKGETQVSSIVTDEGEYPVDMVIMAIGFTPNNELGKDHLKLLDSNGAYLVDRHQQTSIADVYAIGDCATVYSNALQNDSYIALATNAVRSGVVAGHNICGTPLESIGVQGSNAISIYGYNMVSTGLNLQAAAKAGFDAIYTDYEDLQRPVFIKNNGSVKIRIIYDKLTRRILGTQLASTEDISMAIHMFSLAINEQMTIDRLKLLDIFFLPHFNQPYNYITMAALTAK